MRNIISILIIACLLAGSAAAQADTVPDLSGLSVPEAAAALNRVGMALGAEVGEAWTAESGLEAGSIVTQSVAAGSAAQPGVAVDVTVLRSPNVLLIFDDNDLTLVNQSGGVLDLTGLSFNASAGSSASFAASRWSGSLRAGQCTQVWSVGRNGPKGLDECSLIQNWLVTTNIAEHFWTAGATNFRVLQNGIERASCAVSNPGRCEFYVAAASAADNTPYVYFAYTDERLAIINQSDDQWMALAGFTVYNNFGPAASAPIPLSDASLYGGLLNPAARIGQLAPGQCILFTNGTLDLETPQPCDVIARLAVDPALIFWGAAFEMDSLDGQRRSCPAATAGRLTLCIMPR